MIRFPFLIILISLLVSCGKNHDEAPLIKKRVITYAVPADISTKKLKLFHHIEGFKNTSFDIELKDDGTVTKSINNENIGHHSCASEKCEEIDIFLRIGAEQTRISLNKIDELDVIYTEGENSADHSEEYAKAEVISITSQGSSFTKKITWVNVTDYQYPQIRNQVFFKKYYLNDNSSEELVVSAKLPSRTTRDEKVYTDISRNGFRTTYRQYNHTHSISDDFVFAGEEAFSEIHRFFGDIRPVHFKIVGFFDLTSRL